MKLILLLKSWFLIVLMLAGFVHFSIAQTTRKPDIITLRNDSKLEVIIQEVDENNVKYKKLTDQEGPVFTLKKSEIVSIQYGNGEVETFEAVLEVPSYYSPSQSTRPASANPPTPQRPPVPRNKFAESVQNSTPDHLRSIYKYYKTRSKTGMIMGIAGTSLGVIVAGIGTGIVASATDANGNFATYQDEQRAIKGAWMMIGGFAGAATFGTVGFIKAGKNGSKASRIRRELIHRGEPLTIRVAPGYNPLSQAGYLTLSMKF
ncbi:hypothetical protein [Dyadobacter pollutisoli]|uniref:Uncharacterized protein n=1 Tax=Dyadobacter pollutisoli TaxID=2910158 RepID=A0A9E8NAV4_9BACT|nr:hypothetical protein [Dyadobacter pollutisoli]WAC10959.1 hypothetical protein ON006_24830 [Dyadobacter pollutisoli]